MQITEKDIQGIHFGGEHKGTTIHKVHKYWLESISSRKSIPFIPKKIVFLRDWGPAVNQVVSLICSPFVPRAKLYILTGMGCAPSIFFKNKKSKIILINSDTFFRNYPNYSLLAKKWASCLLKRVDGIISTSKMMQELAQKHVTCPCEVVYPFCDVARFINVKSNLNSPNICTIGMNLHAKGTDILIKAFEIYQKTYPDAKLYICGDHIYKKKIKNKDVIVLGICDPAPVLSKCGVYINSSRHESFGVNIIEAMCAGIPPVVTEFCGAKEFVEKIDPKLICPLNPQKIAKSAIEYFQNPNKYELGKKAKNIASKLTKKSSIRNFQKAFIKLIKENS
ncbi:glycosyltransferase [Candidatus Woesearchaeota archaeon]|nr:glycosyltransferase [Candidatus Woesearchaeota archaeon]